MERAPVLDGKIDVDEWNAGAPYRIARKSGVVGAGRILRHKRDLYIVFRGQVPGADCNVRYSFTDVAARTHTYVSVSPLWIPSPPLVLHQKTAKGQIVRRSAKHCAVRSRLEGKSFIVEWRIPLAEIGVPRTDAPVPFYAQFWDMRTNRCVAAYPPSAHPRAPRRMPVLLRPVSDWGSDVETDELQTNEALELLEALWREHEWVQRGRQGVPPAEVIDPHQGEVNGRRKDGPLAELEKKIARYLKENPDFVSFAAHLGWVRIARNNYGGAVNLLRKMRAAHPQLADSVPLKIQEVMHLRNDGRYEEALGLLEGSFSILQKHPHAKSQLAATRLLVKHWAVEKKIRAEEAKRDDLPRVLLKTSKGDIEVELFEDDAPNAVANFIRLVERGFYDGTRFHNVRGGGHVVGGDPNSKNEDPDDDGFGGPGYLIEPEIGRRLHFPFTLTYIDTGTARRAEGSIFAIPIVPSPSLDGANTVFGRVHKGHDVVRALEYYDRIEKAKVLRKRDHPYLLRKRSN